MPDQLGDSLGVFDVGLATGDGLHVRGVEPPDLHHLFQAEKRRWPRGPGVRTQAVSGASPTSRPATRSNSTSTWHHFPLATIRRRLEGPLTGDRPTCSAAKIQRARGPRDVHLTGLDAPMCQDAAGRQPQCPRSSNRPAQRLRTQPITPHASRVRPIRGDEFMHLDAESDPHGRQTKR